MIVFSAIFGGHDHPKPPRPHPRVSEWVLFTDDPGAYAPGWRVVVSDPPGATPRMRGKWHKCHPPESPDDLSLFLDGSIRLRDPDLIEAALGALEAADWAMFRHPDRSDVRSEVLASEGMAKYAGARLREQLAAYEAELSPGDLAGLHLWAAGVLARRHTPAVLAAGRAWYDECARWTAQDQVSLPVVLDRYQITPAALGAGGSLWGNRHFTVEPHESAL